MRSISPLIAATWALAIGAAGCGSQSESATSSPPATNAEAVAEPVPNPAANPDPAAAQSAAPSESITAARSLLKSGQVDEAAARLIQAQLQSSGFDTRQAKDFRQAYSEAYDRALEAIQRGDPRGQAALQLLRAAAPK